MSLEFVINASARFEECLLVWFQMIRMLAEKAKQQEEMLVEYDEFEAHNKDMESEVELLRAQVDSIKEELKVGWSTCYWIFLWGSLASDSVKVILSSFMTLVNARVL